MDAEDCSKDGNALSVCRMIVNLLVNLQEDDLVSAWNRGSVQLWYLVYEKDELNHNLFQNLGKFSTLLKMLQ